MTDKNGKRLSLSRDARVLLKGLIIGKVLTILVIGGGLFWWFKSRSDITYANASSSSQDAGTAESTFQTITDVPSGLFNYGGSPAWAPIRQSVDSQLQSARPELQLRYVDPPKDSPGSGSGLRMLLAGQLDFAQSSRPIQEKEYAAAQQLGFTLEQRPVAIDGIAVVVNHSLQVPGLTLDQLRQIYLGQITNWKQVGGPDLVITPFSPRPEEGDALALSAQSGLQNQSFSPSVRYVYSTTEALRKVSKTPGSLYYASARSVIPQCSVKPLPLGRTPNQLVPPYRGSLVPPEQCPMQRNQLNAEVLKNGSYPITRNLYVIIKQNKGREQHAGEAYARFLLTDTGQQAIERAGFVREPQEVGGT